AQPLLLDTETVKFDLDCCFREDDNNVYSSFVYATDLFRRETIERMGQHYVRLLEEMVREGGQGVGEVVLLSEAEWEQVVGRKRVGEEEEEEEERKGGEEEEERESVVKMIERQVEESG